MLLPRHLLALAFVLPLGACPQPADDPPTDRDDVRDAGPDADGGPEADAGPGTDAGPDVDAGPGTGTPVGGMTLDLWYGYNSLHNHAQPGSLQNASTRVGNWLARMAAQAPTPNTITLASQFGFPNAWSIPPQGSAGHEEVTSPYITDPSWAGAGQIEVVGMVPDNFDGWAFDPLTPTNMGFAYQTRLLEIIDAWEDNAPNANRRYVVYAGWPSLGSYGGTNDDPATVSAQGYADWVAFGLDTYQDWLELLVSRMRQERPGLDIRLHNVSKAVLITYRDTVVGTLPATTLFEDLAPHGRDTWYFLAAVAEYIELFNEKPPTDFAFNPAWGVSSTVIDNYQTIVDHIWGVLRP